MTAADHLGPQWQVGDKFAHRSYTVSNSPDARAAREAEPDHPGHYEKFVVKNVSQVSGAITATPYPLLANPSDKRMTPEDMDAKAIRWGKPMDPSKLQERSRRLRSW